MKKFWLMWITAAALAAAAVTVVEIQPAVETEPVAQDVDDPSIWIHPKDPARSLIVATVKRPRPDGALAVYTLDGKLVETVGNLDRPNNVDILGDICVATERLQRRLLVYRVSEEKPHLRPIGAVPVFEGEQGETGAPMGIALYQRKRDKALFAIVSRKTGPADGYLWQYQLQIRGNRVDGRKVRAFGAFSGQGEIEAVAVDPERELIYYADEDCCVLAYPADPDHPQAARPTARFAEQGFAGNREGIAVAGPYVIVTDQLDPRSEYHVYRRSDWQPVAVWRGTAQSTDGIDAVARPMGPRFPRGFLVAMNNAAHNFHLYAWPE